ncbi:sensor domain-containing diguanylate cyclase [Pseudomonas auratipiscis]|uniref:diguanylate cyclase n=1 Tax=Pseudomonas auratipiscis TaxID=3115853 RepID=A0AB35WRR8_9PSED|nr:MULTISPECIES: sensor domain-containing diguanylate cyclase [unclassified Pseudomonas]MEE1865820.1 sensor domain-containing diguanylate cyclase [Pseudomonas sp. 120P]MEE1957011.1 sensor domain-containing diguanylate cyclase [Pseudomonas sp. 119P]
MSEFVNDSEVYKTLLESTKAIPWKIDWASMKFAYIGPQIEALLGWSPESWVSVEDWAMRMHPEDREYVVNFCVTQSQAGVDHEADYRALTKDNGYVWIRDVVHVVRNDKGEVEALIGFMFDISERKKTEDQLLNLQKELEVLSFKDGLTNIANRRRFDSCFELEWERARRERQPLSLLLLDVDFFKQYNDLYGHIQGDKCLIAIAQTLSLALDGPRDLVARFGGEEFIVLLPGADAEVARKVADRCQRLIQKQSIVHALSPHGHRVTVSIGAGSVVPGEGGKPTDFISAVDQQLYAAKNNGRHRIEYVELEGLAGLQL